MIVATVCVGIIYSVLGIFDAPDAELAKEVFWAKEKALITNQCTTVYLGDSVCNQLWSEYDEDTDGICHLGCNQAITLAGSYLLLKDYLENNPQTENVYFLVRPQTLANDIWLNYSYQYLVIPFCDSDNMELLEPETKEELYKKFGKIFVESTFVKRTLLKDNLLMKQYLEKVQKQPEIMEDHRISKTTEIYLRKMKQLCDEKNVELVVKPNPLSDKEQNYGWDEYEQDILSMGFDDILGEFIEKIPYYPVEWFKDDAHFKKEILEQYGDEIRTRVLD